MMRKAIVFDLDDTLIATHNRHYQVYKYIFGNLCPGKKSLGYEEYLTIRLKKSFSNAKLMNYVHELAESITLPLWLSNIEQLSFLKYDLPLVQEDILERVNKDYYLFVLSLRTNLRNAKEQFSLFSFSRLFVDANFINHSDLINPKIDVLKSISNEFLIVDFVGDSEMDYQAAMEAGVPFSGVHTGICTLNLPSKSSIYPTINQYLNTLL